MTTATAQTLDTPDGAFTLVTDGASRVMGSGWTDNVTAVVSRIHASLRPTAVEMAQTDAADAVIAFYDGDLQAIASIAVLQHGTDMQRAGWEGLRRIAPGRPLSYAEFAAKLGHPRAVRAAASICARNAPALFVPCHRVLRANGSMGGFAWGEDVKVRLLAREAAPDSALRKTKSGA